MQDDVITYINGCQRCLRRKSQADVAPSVNIETTQPQEMFIWIAQGLNPGKET